VGGLVYLWSTCGPMELGPAFSKVLTIKGGGHGPGGQKGGSGGRASCHRSRSFGSSYPRRKEGRSESPGRRQEFQELRSLTDRAGLRTGSRPTASRPVGSRCGQRHRPNMRPVRACAPSPLYVDVTLHGALFEDLTLHVPSSLSGASSAGQPS
jgi:hypothetical protein